MFNDQIVRIGHPARIVEAVQKYSLDALLSAADSANIIKDVRKDLQNALVSTTSILVHGTFMYILWTIKFRSIL